MSSSPTLQASARLTLAVTLLAPFHVLAEQDPIIVTATRLATPASQLGSSVTVITAQDIARKQVKTVPQALRMLPGVDVIQSGGPGQQTSVFIRGASSSHTLVLVDGVNIADPGSPNGAVDFSSLVLDNIEKIEIVRGPQSTLYGANAIGGVISIITRKGHGKPHATLSLQAGNHRTDYEQLGFLGATGGFNYSLSGTHLKTHASSVTPKDLRQGLAAEADHHYNNTLSAKVGFEAAEGLGVSLSGRYITDKTELDPEVGFGTIEDPNARLKNREYFLHGESHASWFDGRLDTSLAAAYTDYNRRNNNPRSNPAETLQRTRFQGDTLEVSVNNDFYLTEAHTLTLGGGTKREHMNNGGFSDFGGFVVSELSNSSKRTNYAYLQDQFSFFKRVFGTAGLRFDSRDDFGSELTYRLTGAYQHHPSHTRFTGSIGTGFRAPSLFELSGFSPNNFGTSFRGNPNLNPEKSFAWELGFEQSFLTGRLSLGGTYFRNDIKDLIETVFDASFNSSPDNINKVHLRGFEAFVSADILAGLSTRVDYTFTSADVSDNSNRPLLRRPRRKVSATLNYQPVEKANIYLGIDFVGRRKDINRVSGAVIKAKDYTVFDTSVSYAVTPRFSLEGRVNNLLNAHYEPADGFAALSRNFLLGFKGKL